MPDARFFTRAGPFTLATLAKMAGDTLIDGVLADSPAAERSFDDVAPLDQAESGHVSFLDNRKYIEAFRVSRAGACLIRPELAGQAPDGMVLILCKDPYRAYARIAALFYPPAPPTAGISRLAHIDPTAILGQGCQVEPGAVIEARADIGDHCRIGANAVIGAGVIIGAGSFIGAATTISHAVIGARAILHPGVRIGQDGFGFAMGPEGHLKVPQLGRVVIHDDVEIGANSTIDRGAGPDTVIGAGCKIDNLVQIGHNVQLGRGCILVSQCGISGSTRLGDFVVVAGQAGVTGHLQIGTGVRIGAQSGVMRDIEAGQTVGGSPAVPMTQWLRQVAELGRLVQKKGR